MKIGLSPLEVSFIQYHGQDKDQILKIKDEWYGALNTLKSWLLPGSIKVGKIVYYPPLFDVHDSSLATVRNREIEFSTPNKDFPFDFYPGRKTKLGVMGHEALGHPVDVKQHHQNDWKGLDKEYETFLSPEQRADLYVMHALPHILYESKRQYIYSILQRVKLTNKDSARIQNVNLDFGKYEDAVVTTEMLGRAGLPRTDNIPKLFKKIRDEEGPVIILRLLGGPVLSLAGLAVPPELNHETKYGIRTKDELAKVQLKLFEYMEGKTKESPRLITCSTDGYRPQNLVDLREFIRRDITLELLDKQISHWQNRFRRHNEFNYAQDMYRNLQIMHDGVKELA